MSDPFAVVTVEQMRALEAAAIAAGTHERVLQERAGLAVADVIEDDLAASGRCTGRRPRIVVLVGTGNNGRDGAVAGRRLAARGCDVLIWNVGRNPLSEAEMRDFAAEGIEFPKGVPDASNDGGVKLSLALNGADYVIDGLLGVGSRGPMRPWMAEVASLVRSARTSSSWPRVVAVDVPSGIDSDTGAVPGVVVSADVTVTFGAVKAGLLRFPAAGHVGRLVVRPIGLPADAASDLPIKVLDEPRVTALVPSRPLDSHKYRLGRVLVVAGSDQFVGAACMASEAAARAGAGLIGVVCPESVKRVLATRLPEATYPVSLTHIDERPVEAAEHIAEILPEQAALLVGPGIGRAAATATFLQHVLAANAALEKPRPTVIDADALTLLAGWERWWSQIGEGNVLTPHAGEMVRLLASDPELPEIDGEAPWDIARRAAERWKQVVVLKGPFTTVADYEQGITWVYPHANPALATAGTGDVLAGLISGLVAQGLGTAEAAQLGVVVHALAGRRAVEAESRRTLLASDLPPLIPVVLHALAHPDARA